MPKLRKGELALYKLMNPKEMNEYVVKFPENSDYVKSFLEKYRYDWVSKKWKNGRTI
jgi:hypothetical protein